MIFSDLCIIAWCLLPLPQLQVSSQASQTKIISSQKASSLLLVLWWTSSGSRANSFWVWLVLLYSAHLNQIRTDQRSGTEIETSHHFISLICLIYRWCMKPLHLDHPSPLCATLLRGKQPFCWAFISYTWCLISLSEQQWSFISYFWTPAFQIYNDALILSHSLFIFLFFRLFILLCGLFCIIIIIR